MHGGTTDGDAEPEGSGGIDAGICEEPPAGGQAVRVARATAGGNAPDAPTATGRADTGAGATDVAGRADTGAGAAAMGGTAWLAGASSSSPRSATSESGFHSEPPTSVTKVFELMVPASNASTI